MTTNAIVIFTYARSQLLRDSISSVLAAVGNDHWKKVLVHQLGNLEVKSVVDEFANSFDIIVSIEGQQKTTLGNINFNRILGTQICFETLGAEMVLGIEEDSMIGYDSLAFIEEIFEQYSEQNAFRGINLGSFETETDENFYTYSLLRFGLHGQAGVLTKRTWNRISKENLLNNIDEEGWDSRIEHFLKSGFMVTPNRSRLLDRGWVGTHAPNDSGHPYFESMKSSWVGTQVFPLSNFKRSEITHSWRKDARNYRKRDFPFYFFRARSCGSQMHKLWRKFGLPLPF